MLLVQKQIQDISKNCPFTIYKNSMNSFFVESSMYGRLGSIVFIHGSERYQIYPQDSIYSQAGNNLKKPSFETLEEAGWALWRYRKSVTENEIIYIDDQVLVAKFSHFYNKVVETKHFREIGSITTGIDHTYSEPSYVCFRYKNSDPSDSQQVGRFSEFDKAVGQIKDYWCEF